MGVAWKPMLGALVPIQREPSGLLAPGGMGSRPAAQGELGGTQVGILDLRDDLVGAGRRGVPGHADRDRRVEHALAVADQVDAEAAQVHDDALGAELQQLGRRDAGDGQVVRALERAHGSLGARVHLSPEIGHNTLAPATTPD